MVCNKKYYFMYKKRSVLLLFYLPLLALLARVGFIKFAPAFPVLPLFIGILDPHIGGLWIGSLLMFLSFGCNGLMSIR